MSQGQTPAPNRPGTGPALSSESPVPPPPLPGGMKMGFGYVRAARETPPAELWVSPLLWFFATIGLAGCGSLALVVIFAGIFGFGGPIVIGFPIITFALVSMRLRRQRVRTILTYLEQAVRLNLPLPQFLAAAAASEKGRLRIRLMDLERVLDAGGSIGQGLTYVVPECPTRIAAIVAAAEQNGQLGPTLTRIVHDDRPECDRDIGSAIFIRFYPLALLGFGTFILSGVMYFVVPRFREIFADFRAELPWLTQKIIGLSNWFANDYGWLIVWPLIAIALLVLMGRYVRGIFMNEGGAWLLTPMLDRVMWYVPGLHGMARDRGLADVCEHLAQALKTGTTASLALRAATDIPDNCVLRNRIARWRDGAERGSGFADAAAKAGLPVLLVGLVTSGATGGNLPEALAFLARYYRVRFSRTAILVHAAAGPLMVLVMGTLVGTIVLALMMPLVTLIEKVSEVKGGM